MAQEYSTIRARRVVVGLDADGKSAITSDGLTDTHLVTDAFARNDLWQATRIPSPVSADNTLTAAHIPPPEQGYTYNITAFPPDGEWDYEGGYDQALADAGAADAAIPGEPGMHVTETVDIVTILSGELWAIVETGETLLKPGDTLVQRGTKHAWRNRGDVPAVMVAIQIAATR
jgi:mannose-6-phosphate isomerase-like protein (cupin superfamily)